MLVDSHCHLDFPGLAERVPEVLAAMAQNGVTHALCVGVSIERFPAVRALAEAHANLYASVGVHPDHREGSDPGPDELAELACHPKVVAIGETGLDYYRVSGDLEWQRSRFRNHIRAARACGKPLIIHTRDAAADTLALMREEGAREAGGVMHCFTGDWETAQAALDLGFLISFSGIITFRNAAALRQVCRQVPLDRILVETDAPYLAPAPHRGKTNEPAFVRHVAEELARIRSLSLEEVADATSRNFVSCFKT